MSLLYAPEESRREEMGEEGTLICPQALKNESLRVSRLILSLLIWCLLFSFLILKFFMIFVIQWSSIMTKIQTVLYVRFTCSCIFCFALIPVSPCILSLLFSFLSWATFSHFSFYFVVISPSKRSEIWPILVYLIFLYLYQVYMSWIYIKVQKLRTVMHKK